MAQWSECMTTGLGGEVSERGGTCDFWRKDVHSVFLGYDADMVGSGDSTGDRSLLLVIWKTLAGEKGGTTLGDLDDDGGLDVAVGNGVKKRDDGTGRGKEAYRAASRTEFATEEEVTF